MRTLRQLDEVAPRVAARAGLAAVVARAFVVHGNGRVWLLLLVRCPCGATHQHRTKFLDFGEGIRKGGCGMRYVVRVGAVRGHAA